MGARWAIRPGSVRSKGGSHIHSPKQASVTSATGPHTYAAPRGDIHSNVSLEKSGEKNAN